MLLFSVSSACNHGLPPPKERVSVPPPATVPVWVDTDLVVDTSGTTDPDDLIALRLLAWLPPAARLGISASSANGSQAATRASLDRYVGLDHIIKPEAVCQMKLGLQTRAPDGVTLLALGPGTNLPQLISCFRQQQVPIREVIFVGGREPGEQFWLSAPISFIRPLRDLNYEADPAAFRAMIDLDVPITLVPFRSGNALRLRLGEVAPGLDDRAYRTVRNWIATLSLVGGAGTMPAFDPTAVAYLFWPEAFDCRPVWLEATADALIAQPTTTDGKPAHWCEPRVPSDLAARIRILLRTPEPRG